MTDYNLQTWNRLIDRDKNPRLARQLADWNARASSITGDGHYIDFNDSGLEGGLYLGRIATADTAKFSASQMTLGNQPVNLIQAEIPNAADTCIGLQYAGMGIMMGEQYIPGSGAMRCAAGSEEVYDHLSHLRQERPRIVTGTLEMEGLPDHEVFTQIKDKTNRTGDGHTHLGIASVESCAGMVAVACRVVEVMCHVWYHRGFPLKNLVSGVGSVPACPDSNGEGMIRTNEAMALAGQGILRVAGIDSDEELQQRANLLVSSAADALGSKTFREVFTDDAGGKIGTMFKNFPFAFALAKVSLTSEVTGTTVTAGNTQLAALAESWGLN